MEGIFKDYNSYRGCKAIFPIMGPMESLSKLAPLIEEQNETVRETEVGLPLWLCPWQKLLPHVIYRFPNIRRGLEMKVV